MPHFFRGPPPLASSLQLMLAVRGSLPLRSTPCRSPAAARALVSVGRWRVASSSRLVG